MPLNLYRRHRQECEAGHPEELRSGEFEERKKGLKRSCHIFASGAHAPPLPSPVSEEKPATTIEQAIRIFLAEREEILAPNTYRKNSYNLNSLKQHSVSKGYVLLTQWTPIDIWEFRTSWGVAPNTARNTWRS